MAAAEPHPEMVRLRAELAAAHDGVTEAAKMSREHRDRMFADLRAGVPDAAGRAAHALDADVIVAELQRYAATPPAGECDAWDDVLRRAVTAARATAR